MKRFWNWLTGRLWPWSALCRLNHQLDFTRTAFGDYKTESERWYSLCRRQIPPADLAAFHRTFDQEACFDLAQRGRVGRPDKPSYDPSIPTELEGNEIDKAMVPSKRDLPSEQKMLDAFGHMSGRETEHGGPFVDGGVFDISWIHPIHPPERK